MSSRLRDDAVRIWRAGVAAVDSARLVGTAVRRDGQQLTIAGETFSLTDIDRIVVVGGGKAGAGMALGLEQALGDDLVREKVSGWLNVPADCVQQLQAIRLHAGRPAGVNEPTAAGVQGTDEILRLVQTLTPRDLCLVLLSGGGSALLPAPIPGITLADKQAVTRGLMHGGASIDELNTVRSCLSRFKSGGLLRHMTAGRSIALIISDVIGDPLSIIASGPTVDQTPDAARALEIVQSRLTSSSLPSAVLKALKSQVAQPVTAAQGVSSVQCRNVIIGNNQTAIDAAAVAAAALGYEVVSSSTNEAGVAKEVGAELARQCEHWRHKTQGQRAVCMLSGGEPIVKLAPSLNPRKGGRNQELVLAAAQQLWQDEPDQIVILSGGTDGEDGPTDAAGAIFDLEVRQAAAVKHLAPEPFLATNNSYPFFQTCGGLLKTGPTHTNVMDLRVVLVGASVPSIR